MLKEDVRFVFTNLAFDDNVVTIMLFRRVLVGAQLIGQDFGVDNLRYHTPKVTHNTSAFRSRGI